MGSAIASRLLGAARAPRERPEPGCRRRPRRGWRDLRRPPRRSRPGMPVVFLCLPGRPRHRAAARSGGAGRPAGAGNRGDRHYDEHPDDRHRDRRALAERGVDFADSPIAGGVRARPRRVPQPSWSGRRPSVRPDRGPAPRGHVGRVPLGPVGAGHAMKLVNNLLNACNRFAALEAVRLGQARGSTQDVVVDVHQQVERSQLRDRGHFPPAVTGGSYKPQGFASSSCSKTCAWPTSWPTASGTDTGREAGPGPDRCRRSTASGRGRPEPADGRVVSGLTLPDILSARRAPRPG